MSRFSAFLALGTVALTLVGIQGQAAINQQHDFFHLDNDQQILNIAQYLAADDVLTKKLIKIAQSLTWLEESTNGNQQGNAAMMAILDGLPAVFSSQYFKAAVLVAFDEIRRVQIDSVTKQALFNETVDKTNPYRAQVPIFSAKFNETLGQITMRYMLAKVNWMRAVNRYINLNSARDLLYEVSNQTTVNRQCYEDTMDFIDAIVGARFNQTEKIYHYGWAVKMFDSYGKPSGGIMKGALHYIGSFDECNAVHAYIPRNDTLFFGQHPHDHDTEFDTRFCRVTFNLPEGLTDSFGVDTHGIQLRLHWGMCFPDSCHSDDVAALFRLGLLYNQNFNVYSVFCTEEEHIEDDSSAIVAVAFLALLVGMVLLCTLLEAWVIFYNNNFAAPAASSHGRIEDTEAAFVSIAEYKSATIVYENSAYEPDKADNKAGETTAPAKASTSKQTGEAGVPVSYVHHREDPPVFKDGLPRPANVNGSSVPSNNNPPASYTKAASQANGTEKRTPALVKAFSLLTNMPKVLNGNKSPKAIHCLHGIRFFSLMWIILAHSYNYGVVSVIDNPTTVNLVDAATIFRRFTFQGVTAAGFAVDTFFLLSALLVTWLTLKDMGKKKGVGYWITFYVHRFWRLTPLYMIVLMTFACLHTYLGGGPLWPDNLETATNCKKYWWVNLLYVNNLVKVNDMCMGWSWYLSNDMQFYWVSPIFLLSLFYFAPVGLILTVLLLVGGAASAFYFENKNGGDLLSLNEPGNRYWEEVYVAPWCRVGAYAVGMLLGYTFYKTKQTTLKMSTAVIGWVVTWVVGVFLCYITFTKRREGGEEWPRWWEALYESVGRPAWAACVAWIIYACHNNRGGFINSILSWSGFLPLSRLTYAAYLVHPIVMILHAYSKKALIYIDDFDMTYLFLGHAVIAFLTAFLFSLVAEAPALALEKMVLRLR